MHGFKSTKNSNASTLTVTAQAAATPAAKDVYGCVNAQSFAPSVVYQRNVLLLLLQGHPAAACCAALVHNKSYVRTYNLCQRQLAASASNRSRTLCTTD
jgi:hypothetical protein